MDSDVNTYDGDEVMNCYCKYIASISVPKSKFYKSNHYRLPWSALNLLCLLSPTTKVA